MAHTYGEVLPESFQHVFDLVSSAGTTVFIDAGSGYGTILVAAVQTFGCLHSFGIEKFSDKYEASIDVVRQLPEVLQSKITLVKEDVNDTDVLALLSKTTFTSLLYFCNNVAFNSGTISRRFSIRLFC